MMEGVISTPLKRINHPKGDVYRALKQSESSFCGFGEAYFSTVKQNEIKGWKKHQRMTSNLIVPVGEVLFVIYDDRPGSATNGRYYTQLVNDSNYIRLTVPPLVWMAFKGFGAGLNLLLNIASIEHDPCEAVNVELGEIDFDWNTSE